MILLNSDVLKLIKSGAHVFISTDNLALAVESLVGILEGLKPTDEFYFESIPDENMQKRLGSHWAQVPKALRIARRSLVPPGEYFLFRSSKKIISCCTRPGDFSSFHAVMIGFQVFLIVLSKDPENFFADYFTNLERLSEAFKTAGNDPILLFKPEDKSWLKSKGAASGAFQWTTL